ncbi:MAG TPA: hypothetical protein VM802_02545 [Chitinophaga sp.]|uniref:hypothetical protein n=1 Tax=Chitinophaga sp. TaxID=1869181 RepID=UPI002BCC401E|nr:hypothetical protein [Chitinophaga sp.]HVI43715.1 hypothetical protein [Chitinophaga sp.]
MLSALKRIDSQASHRLVVRCYLTEAVPACSGVKKESQFAPTGRIGSKITSAKHG